MGSYIYKVTSKIKTLADGKLANVAVFAYKPLSGWYAEDEKMNRRMHKQTGCYAAEVYVRNSRNFTGRVVMGEDGEEAITITEGSFWDHQFYSILAIQRGRGKAA